MTSAHDHPPAGLGHDGARPAQHADSGEHLCSFHSSEDEQRQLATAFVAGALGAGDRVVYFANEHPPAAIGPLLAMDGIDVAAPMRSGQLDVLDFAVLCDPPGKPDLATALAVYRAEADRSRAAGYPGVRVAVEMGDFATKLGSLEAVASWENAAGHLFDDAGITGLCQYNARRFDEAARRCIAAEHAGIAVDDGTLPLATFSAAQEPGVLLVAGELDMTTAPAFGRALRGRAAVSPEVQVDLAAVTFADVAGLRTVFEVAHELSSDSLVVLRRTPAGLRRILDLLGWRDPRVGVDPR